MSKNTVKVAQAISLLSDVLSSEAECELNEDTETVDDECDEYDELIEQALDFSKDIADELSILNDDLERILDPANDDEADASDWKPLADYEDDDQTGTIDVEVDVGNGEVDISDVAAADADESEPTATAGEAAAHQAAADLFGKNAELEKNNEELNDKIEDLADTIRGWRWKIENLHAVADTFVSEVENL